jgi:hypothetical protein
MFTRKYQPETAQKDASTASNTGYMAELDQWLDETVLVPIEEAIASGDAKELQLAFIEGKQQIKRRVLASYHNGLKAKAASNRKSYDKPAYRGN